MYHGNIFLSSSFLSTRRSFVFRKKRKRTVNRKKRCGVFWPLMCPLIVALAFAALAAGVYGIVTVLTEKAETTRTGMSITD